MKTILSAALALLIAGEARAQRRMVLEAGLDPGLELLGVVQTLAGGKDVHGFAAEETVVSRRIKERFAAMRTHDAVRLTAGLKPAPFDYTERGDVLVRLSPPPELKPELFIPDRFVDEAGGKRSLEAWLGSLRSFAKDSDFGSFFKSESAELAPAVEKFRAAALERDYVGKLERYAGLPFSGTYDVALSPHFLAGSLVNAVVRRDDGSYAIKSVVGPAAGASEYDFQPEDMPPVAWHELSHGVLDTLADVYSGRIARSEPAKKGLAWDCYDVWSQCVKENVVRAVMIRLVAQESGEEAAARQLRSEGPEKYPYLRPMLDRLREYETSRSRYKSLAAFYPRLLDVFPQTRAPAHAPAKAPAAAAPGDPGPDWAMTASGPFQTDGQRRRAVWYIDQCLAAADDTELKLKKSALERLLGRSEAPRFGDSVDLRFTVAPSVELLSVVWALGSKAPGPIKSYDGEIRKAFGAWAGHGSVKHLASLLEKGLPEIVPGKVVLGLSDPPELKPLGPLSDGEFNVKGGSGDLERFLAELRDFALKSKFNEFFAAHAAFYRGLVEAAQRETSAGLEPSAVESYLRTRFKSRYRFVLAPGLPSEYDANLIAKGPDGEEDLRMRSPTKRGADVSFNFDDFASDPAHELTHTATDPLVLARAEELSAYASLLPSSCTDSWTGCVMEHVDIAVTLRALRREKGEEAYRRQLERYEASGFPYLGALCRRLKEYEDDRPLSFAAFFPRLVEVFRDLLGSKIHAQAAANVGAAQKAREAHAPPSAPIVPARPRGPRIEFAVDPRVELYSVIRLVSPGAKRRSAPDAAPFPYEDDARARFSAFASHPVIARAQALLRRDPQGNLPLRLMLRLSSSPSLDANDAVSEDEAESAGGRREVEAFFDELRDFARRARFFDFFADHREDYRKFAAIAEEEALRALSPRSAEDYLGEPFDADYYFPLAPLLPEDESSNYLQAVGGRRRYIRVRAGSDTDRRGLRFMFDSLGNCAAHELAHTVTDPLVSDAAGPGGAPPKGCNDQQVGSWPNCMREHLVYAVTLRMLARDLGEARYSESLRRYEGRGFPFLGRLGEQLKEYEASRARFPTLRSFSPRLLAVFGTAAAPEIRETSAAPEAAPAEDAACRAMKDQGAGEFVAGRGASAAALFAKALAACPNDVEVMLDLGVAEASLGKSAEALKHYDSAVSLSVARGASDWEHAAAALSSRASLHAAAGRAAAARRDLEQALRLAPAEWKERPGLEKRLKALSKR